MQPYKKLHSYWFSVIIYDLTVQFCQKWILSNVGNLSPLKFPDRRTADQMIQAARSGKQNIVEGSEALQTSIKSGITLTGVAKSSLEELLQDYEDFLRINGFEVWVKNDNRNLKVRVWSSKKVSYLSNSSNLYKQPKLKDNPEETANLLLTLCHQATYILFKQIQGLEKKHEKEGGYSEKLYEKRKTYLQKNQK